MCLCVLQPSAFRSLRRSDLNFGSPGWPVFPATLLSDGDSRLVPWKIVQFFWDFSENLFESYGVRMKTYWNFGSRNHFKSDLLRLWKAPTIITKVPASGHTGALPSTSFQGNLYARIPFVSIVFQRQVLPPVERSRRHNFAIAETVCIHNRGKKVCLSSCHAKFVAIASFCQILFTCMHWLFQDIK